MPKMASASKVEYKDWLHLRILCKVSKEKYPTDETMFGDKLKDASVDDLEQTENPLEWHALAHWRESVMLLKNPRLERGTCSGEDLFKLRIEPLRQLRSRTSRHINPEGGPESSQETRSDIFQDSQEFSSSPSYDDREDSQGISLSASYNGSIETFGYGRRQAEQFRYKKGWKWQPGYLASRSQGYCLPGSMNLAPIVSGSFRSDTAMNDAPSSPSQALMPGQPPFSSPPRTPEYPGQSSWPKTPVKQGIEQAKEGQAEVMFLTMHQYKPFKITEQRQMKAFMAILVSLNESSVTNRTVPMSYSNRWRK
ncbi:hypothetical protein J3F83DRAFT_172089 [Trichoderma novae-zelandiae]